MLMLYAAFSVSAPYLIALAAGKIKNPRREVSRVARTVRYRNIDFRVMEVLCVGIVRSSKDPRLLILNPGWSPAYLWFSTGLHPHCYKVTVLPGAGRPGTRVPLVLHHSRKHDILCSHRVSPIG